MYKISALMHKNLLNADTATDLDKIADLCWDKQSGKCAIVTVNGVYGADKMFVGDSVRVVGAVTTDETERPIGKLAYDTTGKLLGKVVDVEFGNTLKLAKVYLNDGTTHTRGKICAVSDIALIRANNAVKTKKAVDNTATAKTQRDVAFVKKPICKLPLRRYGDFSFLIGKVTDKNITNFQGEVMIRQGERVTNNILRQAKVSGKLIELCLHTK